MDPDQAIERILEAKGIPANEDMIQKGVEVLRRIREHEKNMETNKC